MAFNGNDHLIAASKSPDPVRYSLPLICLLTICLLAAEHSSPKQIHSLDVEFLVSTQAGQLQREVAYLILGILGVLGMSHNWKASHQRVAHIPLMRLIFGLLFTLCGASLFWSDSPVTTAKRLAVLGLTFCGAGGLALSWKKDEVLRFIAFSTALQIFVGFLGELYYGYFKPFSSDYRFAGTIPWNSQGYLCLVLILTSLCALPTNKRRRLLYIFLAGFGLFFLLLTRSRGPLASLAVVLFLYLMIVLGPWGKLVSLSVAGLLLLALVMSGTTTQLANTLNRGGEGNDDLTGRGPLWQELYVYQQKHALLGYGYEGFWTPDRIQNISDDERWAINSAHSGYLEVGLEIGEIGLTLHTSLLLLGFAAGVRLYRRTRDSTYFLGASFCLIYLTSGMLESFAIIKTSQTSFFFALLLCWMIWDHSTPDVIPVNLERTHDVPLDLSLAAKQSN